MFQISIRPESIAFKKVILRKQGYNTFTTVFYGKQFQKFPSHYQSRDTFHSYGIAMVRK